ncbi:uncharacterized protein DEA37_0012497 [Paragonimus westermani]|uniref:Uncharacterized protein n=1 Tax=Paragonimus westermani TaxID=34504 RepID=A0A5J4NTL8_9TREM|nr:uncharacterized protein DEA37_0012497 [Paragonimus westermani]
MGEIGDVVTLPKHLKSGDPEPVIDENRYTLIAFRFCPFCDRVRLTLSYHKIDYDLVFVSLSDKPDWLLRLSPSGKVPLLLNKGDRLFESDLVMRFVDELRGPEASLLRVCGAETFQQAADLAGKFFKPAHSILFKPKLAGDEEETVIAFREACTNLCAVLKEDYFSGPQLSLADLILFPMLDRLEAVLAQLKGIAPEFVVELQSTEADSSDYPELVRYLCRMRSLPFVAALRQPVRLHALFAATMRAGQTNPDI